MNSEYLVQLKVLYLVLVGSVASLMAYLNIDSQLLELYSVLMLLDLITGISAAMINREKITRSRLVAGVLSKIIMFIVPLAVAILVKMQGSDLLWFTKWTLLVLGASEAVSILNNVLKAKGKKVLPEFDAISIISEKIRTILEKLFNKGNGSNV